MEEALLSRGRGAIAVRGLLALAFGVVALSWPGLTLMILVLSFATYAIADGVFTIGSVASGSDRERTWLAVIEGLLSIAAGLFVLFVPATAAKLAFVCVGLWALITGAMQLLEAPRMRREFSGDTMLGVSGAVRLLLGIVLLARPHAGMAALVVLLALYAFVEGILMLGLAIAGRPRTPVTIQHA
jgi:uncharacterized membrane protein HdeD (DUF308 family)